MTYSESEIGQTNRQLIEAQSIQRSRPMNEILAELVETVALGEITLEDRKSLERLAQKIKQSKIETQKLLAELDNSGSWGKDANRNSI